MPDVFDADGLQIKTLAELKAELEIAFREIYGDDINTDSNSPDGQTIGIFAQSGVDLREVLAQINSGFDPDQAAGRILDQRVAINGIKRNPGTFTSQDIEIVTDRALSLSGLDDDATELGITGVYTVRDQEGNEFYLLDSQSPAGAGTYSYTFRAAELGQVEVTLNTITTPVTVVPGVISVNNPTGANSIGINEESDFDLKIRRRASTALPAVGYLDAIEASIADLDNVAEVIVLENDTDSVDGNGTNPHTIWAIVEGGDPDEIGEVLYKKKTAGAGLRGAVLVNVPRPDGSFYPSYFDRPVNQDLYIQFNLFFSGVVDLDDLKNKIVENVSWKIGQDATSDVLTSYVKSINQGYVITGVEVSDDGISWGEIESVASPQNRFLNDTSRITIT